nr:hypothetical protein GCM10020092_078130 [Actinoplanes digitatis]
MFDEAICPSTDCDEYFSAMSGRGPVASGGTRSGYDQVKSPDGEPPLQVEEAFNGVAVKSPAEPEGPAVNASVETAPPAARARAVGGQLQSLRPGRRGRARR